MYLTLPNQAFVKLIEFYRVQGIINPSESEFISNDLPFLNNWS